ncbi:Prohormone-4 [Aphelenchoides fujianensis]|nr:Prohormone-4 [Aphelenchoides fujianensis]
MGAAQQGSSASSTVTTLMFVLVLFAALAIGAHGFSIREIVRGGKRSSDAPGELPPMIFGHQLPRLVAVQLSRLHRYLCDGSPDCSNGYDENERLCTAAKRPPPLEIASFLSALLSAHGPNFGEKLFGARGRNEFAELGGTDQLAVAFSQSPTIESFATDMNLTSDEAERLALVLEEILTGETAELSRNEAADFAFFARKLRETNFI